VYIISNFNADDPKRAIMKTVENNNVQTVFREGIFCLIPTGEYTAEFFHLVTNNDIEQCATITIVSTGILFRNPAYCLSELSI
jgi:hypothetical protein